MALVVVLWSIYQKNLKMGKEDEHIIDWVLKKTDHKKQKEHYNFKKRASSYDNRKIKLDDMILYCLSCERTWSHVPKWIDASGWRSYPRNHIPTIGKKRIKCPLCRSKNGKP